MTARALHAAFPSVRPELRTTVAGALLGAGVAGLAFAAAALSPSAGPAVAVAIGLLGSLVAWMATSRNVPLTLAALMLWLALFDGFLRLKTGVHSLTLLRDVLLYAIVGGWLVRATARGDQLRLPPLSGWVLAFVGVVLVQLFNPANLSIGHAVAAVRPHLEWVLLFFLGYSVMRTRRRLRIFLVLLLSVTAVNGVVSAYQSRLTPEAFAAWGPGYAERVYGTGDVSGRVGYASDLAETPFVRPFALGSDINFGGTLGVLAIAGAMALFALGRRPRDQIVAAAFAVGVVVAVATSQARTDVIAAVAAAGVFLALASVAGRTGRALLAILTVGLLAAVLGPVLASLGGFNRYESITPGRALSTTYDYRRESFGKLPEYIRDFPLGAGLGSVGPAGRLGRSEDTDSLDAENEFNFLVIELGVAGLLVLTFFNIRLLTLVATRLRAERDVELRLLLAAIAAPLFALFVTWIAGVATATSPGAPYLWFAAGTLVYWLAARRPESDSSSGETSNTAAPVGGVAAA